MTTTTDTDRSPGTRGEDGGMMGTYVSCHECGGSGVLHDPDEVPEAVSPQEMPEPEGWFHPLSARKHHYFRAGRRALCGKWELPAGLTGELQADDGKTNPDDCVACARKLRQTLAGAP